jgi:putative toxin-antitoxin system antitoxin component (TIGR02293 family)
MGERKLSTELSLNRQLSSFVAMSNLKPSKGGKYSVTYAEFMSDKLLVTSLIRAGITYKLFSAVQEYTPFTEKEWASLLQISLKSLQRYREDSNYRFKPFQSEKIIEMAEVTLMGLEVFGDMEKFKRWLTTPNFALGRLEPLELLQDSYGKELVMSELVRIDHGIFV